MSDEEKAVLLAKVAERAERYDEMAEFMKERVEKGGPLTVEERDLFSAAYKGSLTARRHALRVSVTVENAEREAGREDKAALAAGFKSKVENELRGVCSEALGLITGKLVPGAEPGEPKIFYLKMQGDYLRYSAEFATGETRTSTAEEARTAYTAAMAEAEAALATTHPVRLGLALNFSVFQHEVIGDTPEAVRTARTALTSAARDISEAPDESQSDATLTMQLLQDNLSLWEEA